MSEVKERPVPIHLSEDEVLNRLPERIGDVILNYRYYPGKDLYSDGTIEDEILAIVKDASKVEYPAIIERKKSWPVLYHLSPLRGNIVDWLPIGRKDKVLEIGSGCGAITEKLAEKAGTVTCVDLSAKRSHINAYRNHDKDNIEIHVGNFSDIEPSLPKDYDYICMIGAFEYGQSYIHTDTPYEDFFKIIKKHIKDKGRIIIAIENKLGLKYWAGCKEDHLGTWFSGLEGYPEGGSARTFTRKGLEKIFLSCGVTEYSFYYPYPDYKFPTMIFSDKRLPNQGELTDNMRNFDRDRLMLFNEKYVFDGIVEDGLFDIFSNSFLAVIGEKLDTSYVKYSNDRAVQYALRTEITDTKEGRVVRKIPLNERAWEHIKEMKRFYNLLEERYRGSGLCINPCELKAAASSETRERGYAEFPYEKGTSLETLLDQCLEKNDMDGFYRLFDRYYELIAYGEGKEITDYDMIFGNILADGDKWTVIDYEWTIEERVPAAEIAFRALYCYVLAEEKRNKLDLGLLMGRLGISEQTAGEYRMKEKRFQKQVTGKRKSMGELRDDIGNCCVSPMMLMELHKKEILNQRIQLYYDWGEGFKEEDSRYIPDIYLDDYKIAVEIPFDGNIRALRIDPADRSCMVKMMELSLNGSPVPLHKRYVETNGKAVKTGCYVFDTQDPNITVWVSALPMTGENILSVKMEITPVPSDMALDVMGAIKKFF